MTGDIDCPACNGDGSEITETGGLTCCSYCRGDRRRTADQWKLKEAEDDAKYWRRRAVGWKSGAMGVLAGGLLVDAVLLVICVRLYLQIP